MRRTLLLFATFLALLVTAPAIASAAPYYEAGVTEFSPESDISIVYSQGVLHVVGANGCKLEIISLTGKILVEESISGPAQKIELNIPKGCYIVKVGDVVRKISVR